MANCRLLVLSKKTAFANAAEVNPVLDGLLLIDISISKHVHDQEELVKMLFHRNHKEYHYCEQKFVFLLRASPGNFIASGRTALLSQ